LIDAELLAQVYLAMTGGQTAMSLDAESERTGPEANAPVGGRLAGDLNLVVIRATEEEAAAHEAILEKIARITQSPD
jgi:DNA polymerase-3 subunit epsilon